MSLYTLLRQYGNIPKLFNIVYQWYKDKSDGKSLLCYTLENGNEEETNFYSRLIDGKNIEIAKVAESLIKEEVPDKWKEILTTRVNVGKAIEKEPESEQGSESSEKKFNYGAEVRLLPCFSAL